MDTSVEAPLSREVVLRLVGNHREFLAFLQKRLGDRALAEDILQEAFVRGLHKLGTLESDESAIAWFYRILRNAVIDHHRRRASVDKGSRLSRWSSISTLKPKAKYATLCAAAWVNSRARSSPNTQKRSAVWRWTVSR